MKYSKKAEIFMRKFRGRTDIYGKKWVSKEKTRSDGTPLAGYAPQCANFWEDVCHIKNKTGISCSECKYQKYNPVTPEVVIKHIKGEEQHLYYLIDPNTNTVWFSAIDFDCKPGKEHLGYKFEDVQQCIEVLKDWGVPHAVARSTTNGFHLYVFYTEAVPANKPLAVMHQLFEELGWAERARLGIKPIPEIFPKQATVGADGLGNGIKPPMIEPQFQKGKNCWVDNKNAMIPSDEQWQYFTDIPRCRPDILEQLIEKYEIDCDLYLSGASVFRRDSSAGGKGPGSNGSQGRDETKLIGTSAEKMMQGCAALRKIRDRILAGEVMGHDEGFAFFHTLYNTEDGEEWCRTHMKGWFRDHYDEKQIDQSKRKGYGPRTCANLQILNLCAKGTKCFEKKRPGEWINGKFVPAPGTEDPATWREPSPTRYAYGSGEDFLEKLKEEIKEIEDETDKEVLKGKVKGIVNRAKVFDKKQQSELEKHIKSLKILKAKEVGTMFADMIIKRAEEVEESLEEDERIVRVGTDHIQKGSDDGHGYELVRYVKGRPKGESLTRTTLELTETVKMIHDDGEVESLYRGEIVCPDFSFRVPFEVSINDWVDSKKLFEKLSNLAQHRLDIANTKHMGLIAQAALKFAWNGKQIVNNVFRTTQGWHKEDFITPSVLVSKDGVKVNDQYKVDLSGKGAAKDIDFQILGEDEINDILFHIKSDLLAAFPKDMIFTGLAHTLLAGVRTKLGIKQKPTLWYEGLSGTGKSAITKILQSFYGPSLGEKLPGWHGSSKYIMDYVHSFNDCLAVVDDYKESLGPYFKKAAKEVVQFSYDDVIRGTLTRTGTAKLGKHNRSLIMSSGEDTPSQEASIIARMIIIECHRRDTTLTEDKFERCKDRKHQYSAITPYFISWFLQQDEVMIEKKHDEIKKLMGNGLNGVQNADRITTNLSMNMLGWQLFVSFCEDKGAMTRVEGDQYIKDHWKILNDLKFQLAERCSEEQQSNIFIGAFRELLFAGEIRIEGLQGYDLRESAPVVGFYKEGEEHAGRVYIRPDLVMREVTNSLRNTGFTLVKNSLASQLMDSGFIVDKGKGKFVKSVRYKKGVHKVWVFSLEQLSIVDVRDMRNFKKIDGGKDDNIPMDKDGLL